MKVLFYYTDAGDKVANDDAPFVRRHSTFQGITKYTSCVIFNSDYEYTNRIALRRTVKFLDSNLCLF